MKNLFFILLIFSSARGWGVEPERPRFVVAPLALEQRAEAKTNPVLEGRRTLNLALGLSYERHLWTLEYSSFSESSGNATFGVERRFQDALAWYRYRWFNIKDLHGTSGVGAGVYFERVTSEFYNQVSIAESGPQWSTAVGLGLEYQPLNYISFMLEGRLIAGQNLDPNPNPSLLARMAFQF